MSLLACLRQLVDKGEVTPEHSRYVEGLYTRIVEKLERQMGAAAAEAMASEQALKLVAEGLADRKRTAVLQAHAAGKALEDMEAFRGKAGKWNRGQAGEALLARDERGSAYSNAEYRERAIRQEMLGKLNDLIERHAHGLTGKVRDPAGLVDVTRELFGEETGNGNAAAIAAAFRDVVEELRLRANAAGAKIARNDDWRLPQPHDAMLTRGAAGDGASMDAAFAAWRDAELPRLDRAKMKDYETGAPLDDAGLERVLRTSFDNIVTDGWATRDEWGGGEASIASRLSSARVLIYRDAESYLASQAQFGGTESTYDAMMGHVHSMSRDVALMERLGPNPAANVRFLGKAIHKQAAVEHGAGSAQEEEAARAERSMKRLYDALAGNERRPESKRLAQLGDTLRGWQVTSKLGSAVLSTTSDWATSALTRAYNGLPMSELATGYAKYLNPANGADRAHAARMGFVAEVSGSRLAGTARIMSVEMGHAVVSRMAEATMRLSGVNAVTEANRQSLGHSFMAQITRDAEVAHGDLDPAFRRFLDRYGFGERGWDRIRGTKVEEANGAPWILPENMDGDLRTRLLEAIYQEMDVAVPTSGVAVRAGLNSVAPKGTWRGEAIRTLFQFKAFPVTLMMIQWQRAMAQERAWDKLLHFGMFFGASALAGAFALQMKEVSKGRDPRPMGSGDFLLEAIAQGGGAGIYGDFVRSTDSRFGSGPLQVISGPGVETLTELGSLTLGNAQRGLKGEGTHFARDLGALARSETPVVGSLFYTRLAYERGALDLWRRAADPMAGAAFARMQRKYLQQYGQGYWWAPGEGAPARGPDAGNVLETPPARAARSQRQGW